MNVIVEIHFEQAHDLTESDLHKGLFSFAVCSKDVDPNEEPPAEEPTAARKNVPKQNTQTQPEDDQPSPDAAKTPKVWQGAHVPFHLEAFATVNETTEKNELRAYLIPKDAGALELGQTYCVGVESFEVPEKALVVEGLSSQFTIKTKQHFHFQRDSLPEPFVQEAIAGQKDFIVLHYPGQNQHIPPRALQKNITLCEETDEDQHATTGPCKDFGVKRSFELYLRESLKSEDPMAYLTASYNLYAVKPLGLESPSSRLSLSLGSDFSQTSELSGEEMTEIFTQQTQATGPDTLLSIEKISRRVPRFEDAFIYVGTEKK